ncbi:MAG: flavodoxin domain-containing protein [Deferrisomatales bacterium]|nr:flavodoxin domain-containing protein [Deferrisomatales bacterium]
MRKVAIVYTTRTGETERMAQVIVEGVQSAGGEPHLMRVEELDDVSPLAAFDAIAVGTPTQEAKEVHEVTAFLDRLAASDIKGRYAAAFGSYGWSGEGPYIAALRLERECGMKMVAEPLRAKQGLKGTEFDVCRAFGMKLVFGE